MKINIEWLILNLKTILSVRFQAVLTGSVTKERKLLKEFFLWCSRIAKIEVIHAEESIKVYGMVDSLIPIVSLDELITLFDRRK